MFINCFYSFFGSKAPAECKRFTALRKRVSTIVPARISKAGRYREVYMIENLNGIFETIKYNNSNSILLYRNDISENYPVHWHTGFEFIMPIENDYMVIIDRVEYHLNPFDIICIPPGELHQLIAPKTGVRLILQFDFAIINNLWDFEKIIRITNRTRLLTPENAPDIHGPLKQIMLEIEEEYFSDPPLPLKAASIYAKILEMNVIIGRKFIYSNTSNFPEVRGRKQMEYIYKFNIIFDYIDKNFTEDISLEDIARVAGFSKFHFSRLFKQYTNQSFYDYLNQRKVKEAERLLLDPSMTITDVAIQSGFSSISTFNRVFKSTKKCTPTEFKNMYNRPDGETYTV